MTKTGFWLNVTIVSLGIAGFVAAAATFGYKWLEHDEPDRSYSCGSGSRSGTCFSGETTNMILALVFGALAIAGIVLCIQTFRSRRQSSPH